MAEATAAETVKKRNFGTVITEHLGYARNSIRYFNKTNYQIIWSFLIPLFILLCSYFAFGVWPFGEESVLSLDLNGQYVYFYDHMYDVLGGKADLFYSWSRNLSGEFMGIIGYYIASPFNFIVWAFPRTMITEGLLTMMVVKVGAIGLAMSIYLTYAKRCNKLTTIIFSVCYALSSYVIVQTMNPMWLDGVLALPLIALGIERLVDQGKFRLLVFSLIYAFVTCFYIGFMLAIFSTIYFLYYLVCAKNKSIYEHLLTKFIQFGCCGIGAAMCSCFMILPVYKSLSYGKFAFSTPDYSFVTNFNLLDLANKIIPNSYDTVRMEGLPFIYCGIIAILFVPAYFFMKKINARERIASAFVLMIMIFCMYIRPIDMLWHGGQLPNWLPYRYSFIITFLLVIFAATAFDRIKEVSKKTIAVTAVAWFALMVYQESLDHFKKDLKNGLDVLPDLDVILPAMIILFIVAAMVIQFKDKLNANFKKTAPRVFAVLLIMLISSEAFYNTYYQIKKQDRDIVYSNRDTYADVIPEIRVVVDEIKENDPGFYRIEKNFFRTVCDPIALNMAGLSHSSSTLNAKPIQLLKNLGFTARSHYTRYSGATDITSSIFGVKYELSTANNDKNDVVNGGSEAITYELNENAMPICYLGSDDILDAVLTENDPFTAQSEMLSAILGVDAQFYNRIYENEMVPENVTQGTTGDGHHSFKVITSGQNAQLKYKLTVPNDGALYMYLPSTYERQVNVWVNGESYGTYFEGDNNYLRNLGEYTAGEEVEVILTLTKDELYFREAQFAQMDTDKVELAFNTLKEMNKETVFEAASDTDLITTVNSEGGQVLFTTVPNEEGWTVYVDGEKTEYQEVFGSLIAIPLTAGSHTVEMKFLTASYPLALIITGAGIALFALAIVFWRKRNKDERAVRKAHRHEIYTGEALAAIKAEEKAELDAYNEARAKEKEDAEEKTITEEQYSDVRELEDWESVNSEANDDVGEDDENFYEGLGEDDSVESDSAEDGKSDDTLL